MFHGVSIDTRQAIRLEERQLRENLESILVDQRKIGSIIADQTSLKSEDIEALFREASTKDADFALRNGIVQAVKDIAIPPGSPLVQLTFQR